MPEPIQARPGALPEGPSQTVHKPRIRVLYALSRARGTMPLQDIVSVVNDLMTGTKEQSQWYVPDVLSANDDNKKHKNLITLGLVKERQNIEGVGYVLTQEGWGFVATLTDEEVNQAFDESQSWATSTQNKG